VSRTPATGGDITFNGFGKDIQLGTRSISFLSVRASRSLRTRLSRICTKPLPQTLPIVVEVLCHNVHAERQSSALNAFRHMGAPASNAAVDCGVLEFSQLLRQGLQFGACDKRCCARSAAGRLAEHTHGDKTHGHIQGATQIAEPWSDSAWVPWWPGKLQLADGSHGPSALRRTCTFGWWPACRPATIVVIAAVGEHEAQALAGSIIKRDGEPVLAGELPVPGVRKAVQVIINDGSPPVVPSASDSLRRIRSDSDWRDCATVAPGACSTRGSSVYRRQRRQRDKLGRRDAWVDAGMLASTSATKAQSPVACEARAIDPPVRRFLRGAADRGWLRS